MSDRIHPRSGSAQPVRWLPWHRYGHGFTLVELLVVGALIAIMAVLLLPALAKAREKAGPVACSANAKEIGLALLMYAGDSRDRLPEAVFNEIYGDAHPLGLAGGTGGERQILLPDRLMPYADVGDFLCPSLEFATQRAGDKFVAAGSYAYMCGHAARPRSLDLDSTPLRVFLYFYGPSARHGSAGWEDLEDAGRFFACGRVTTEIAAPSKTPEAFCNGFGVHAQPRRAKWEADFLPPRLGGKGEAVGSTTICFADGHVQIVRRSFDPMVGILIGSGEPRPGTTPP